MARILRWFLVAAIIGVVALLPFVFYRHSYAEGKRLRVVVPGRVYRSGELNADGFRAAHDLYGIRTVVCLRDDDPDPSVVQHFFPQGGTIKESELCQQLGMRFVFIAPDIVSRKLVGQRQPEAFERFEKVMDDESSYPVLIHCNAGLNRTGVLVAVYRMEYQDWTREQAYRETMDNGFGRDVGTADNDYIMQYILTYEPRRRPPQPVQGVAHD